MTWNRVVVAALALLAIVVVVDAVARDGGGRATVPREGYRIDLATAREGTWLSPAVLREAFPPPRPETVAVSRVAVAPDELVAVGLSHVPGVRRARAAIELWDGDSVVASFLVPPGSFARGLWFAGDGSVIATIGWDERGYLYDRSGNRLRGTAYFAYETG